MDVYKLFSLVVCSVIVCSGSGLADEQLRRLASLHPLDSVEMSYALLVEKEKRAVSESMIGKAFEAVDFVVSRMLGHKIEASDSLEHELIVVYVKGRDLYRKDVWRMGIDQFTEALALDMSALTSMFPPESADVYFHCRGSSLESIRASNEPRFRTHIVSKREFSVPAIWNFTRNNEYVDESRLTRALSEGNVTQTTAENGGVDITLRGSTSIGPWVVLYRYATPEADIPYEVEMKMASDIRGFSIGQVAAYGPFQLPGYFSERNWMESKGSRMLTSRTDYHLVPESVSLNVDDEVFRYQIPGGTEVMIERGEQLESLSTSSTGWVFPDHFQKTP